MWVIYMHNEAQCIEKFPFCFDNLIFQINIIAIQQHWTISANKPRTCSQKRSLTINRFKSFIIRKIKKIKMGRNEKLLSNTQDVLYLAAGYLRVPKVTASNKYLDKKPHNISKITSFKKKDLENK